MVEITTFRAGAEQVYAHGVFCSNRQTCLCLEVFRSSNHDPILTLLIACKAVC